MRLEMVVILSLRFRKILILHDAIAYKLHNRIGRFIAKLNPLRHIATPYDLDALIVDSSQRGGIVRNS